MVKNIFFDIYFNDYFFLLLFFLLSFFVVLALVLIAMLLSRRQLDIEKFSSYECGFEPFETLNTFNVHFYMVGISFLIFDLELAYLYPWALHSGSLDISSF